MWLPAHTPTAAAQSSGQAERPAARPAPSPTPRPIWAEGRVDIVQISLPCVIQLGREPERATLRLRGVDCPRRHDGELMRYAVKRVRSWLSSGHAVLLDPARDERGQLQGDLRLPDGRNLTESLLLEGLALVEPEGLSPDYETILLQAQETARRAGAGAWNMPRHDAPEVDRLPRGITTVCGDAIASQHRSDKSRHVHLGSYRRRYLTVVIPAERIAAFGALEFNYLRKALCVTGRLSPGSSFPEIRVVHPTQIDVRGLGQSL